MFCPQAPACNAHVPLLRQLMLQAWGAHTKLFVCSLDSCVLLPNRGRSPRPRVVSSRTSSTMGKGASLAHSMLGAPGPVLWRHSAAAGAKFERSVRAADWAAVKRLCLRGSQPGGQCRRIRCPGSHVTSERCAHATRAWATHTAVQRPTTFVPPSPNPGGAQRDLEPRLPCSKLGACT